MEETKRTGSASAPSNLVIYWSPDWRINSDQHQWIVEKRSLVEKTGREYWTPKAYYQDLCKVIGFLERREIRALPVEVPADPGCELILKLEDRLDEWCMRLSGAIRQGNESGIRVSDIKEFANRAATASDGLQSGNHGRREARHDA